MTTAREVIRGTLGHHLNVLSPGEPEDADLFSRCLEALNSIVDEINGGKTMLWQQVLSSGFVTGAVATLGAAWTDVPLGSPILAAFRVSGGQDIELDSMSFGTYSAIPDKTTGGDPQAWAQDGAGSVYFWPAASSITQVKLRVQKGASDFVDLDTDYAMPAGYKASLQALLAERVAGGLVGGVAPTVERAVRAAKVRLKTGIEPEIIGGNHRGNIFSGFA